MPENKQRRVADRRTPLIADSRRCATKPPDTFKHLEANYRQEVEHQTDFYEKGKKAIAVRKGSRREVFCKTYKAHITRKRTAIGISYDLYKPIDLLDKDSSPAHHDAIVEKGDPGII